MANNVAATAGAGTTFKTTDNAGVHTGHVNVDSSALPTGAATEATLASLLAEAEDTAPVPVIGHAAGAAVAPSVTAGAYSANDIVGGLMTFTVARAADEEIVITGAQIACKADLALTGYYLVLFNADPTGTTQTDNAAYSLAAADVFKVVATIDFTLGVARDHGTPRTIRVDGLCIPCSPATGTQDIYGLLIDTTGLTLTSTSDIQVRLRALGA